MSIKDVITIIFSSTLITTIITTVFNLVTNKKKDSIENITKERKNWRDELREISNEIYISRNLKEMKIAVSKLKVRINSYGIAINSVFMDTHIWEEIHYLESMQDVSTEELQGLKCKFVNLISCNLKYDWERSKAEIRGNAQTKIVIISLIVSFILSSIRWFYTYNLESDKIYNYISYCAMYALFVHLLC